MIFADGICWMLPRRLRLDHFLDRGKWFLPAAAQVWSNRAESSLGLDFEFEAQVYQFQWGIRPADKWAIDASVFEDQGWLYAIWSGWQGDENGTQSIYIARLKNP